MARTKRGSLPAYRLHKQSGQAIVTLSDGNGGRKDYTLGRYGSEESHTEYTRLVRQWQETGQLPDQSRRPNWTVNEVAIRFLNHVDDYYRHPDGTKTSEARDFVLSLRPLVFLYGSTQANEFDALRLKSVRRVMIDGYEHPKHGPQSPLARSVINQRISRIKRMFRWAASQKLLPTSVYVNLDTVDGLKQGRSRAHDHEPIGPVAPALVAATLPFCTPTLAAMIRVQLLAGARPGEVCNLRGADLDRTGSVWVFRPTKHKTAWRNKKRVIYFGPEAQAILTPFLKEDPEAYLFSPRASRAEWCHQRRLERKTKVQPSQAARKPKKHARRTPGERYSTDAYGKAVKKACRRAGQPDWSPNQLRKLKATEIAHRYGKEVAQAILGHASIKTTEIYALPNHAAAEKLMAEIG